MNLSICVLAYLWTHQQQGCPFLGRLSFERFPAAPSSAQESRQGTGESWWLKAGGSGRATSHSFTVCLMAIGDGVIVCPSIVYSMPMSLEHEALLKAATGRRYLQAIPLNPPQNLINITGCELFMYFLFPGERQEYRA